MPKVEVDGGQVSYRMFGQRGLPMLLIPPPVVGAVTYYHQIAALHTVHQLVPVELRGHGPHASSALPLIYPVIAKDVATLMDRLGIEKAMLCGYSMGGSIVLEFMRKFPERTLGAVLVSGFSEATGFEIRAELLTAVAMLKMGAFQTLATGLALANADSIPAFRHLLRASLNANPHAVEQIFDYALTYNCTADVPHLSAPVKFVFGAKDKRLFPYIKVLKRIHRRVDIEFVGQVSHQIPTKSHTALNGIIHDFAQSLANYNFREASTTAH